MKKRFLLGLFGLICCTSSWASEFGASIWAPLIGKDPPNINGYRAAINYQPKCSVWKNFSIYYDVGFGHWWVNGGYPNSSVSIVSIAPYFRFYLLRKPYFAPFLEASVGAAYLNKTRFKNYNLGIHYSFQDEVSIGSSFGATQQFYVAFTALHYSNCSMASSNAGITVPLVLNMGYRF